MNFEINIVLCCYTLLYMSDRPALCVCVCVCVCCCYCCSILQMDGYLPKTAQVQVTILLFPAELWEGSETIASKEFFSNGATQECLK